MDLSLIGIGALLSSVASLFGGSKGLGGTVENGEEKNAWVLLCGLAGGWIEGGDPVENEVSELSISVKRRVDEPVGDPPAWVGFRISIIY